MAYTWEVLLNRIHLHHKFYTVKMVDTGTMDENIDDYLKVVSYLSSVNELCQWSFKRFCSKIRYPHGSALSRKYLSMTMILYHWKRWQVQQGLKIKILKLLKLHMMVVNDIMLEMGLERKFMWGIIRTCLDRIHDLQ